MVLLLIPISAAPALAGETERRYRFEYELDAYYTNASLFVSLTNAPIPNVGEKREVELYKDMFLRSYLPRFILFEASVNPMPLFGVYMRSNYDSFYDYTEVNSSFNVIKSITAGFEEPYAFSIFMGDVVDFVRPGEERKSGNKGYMGYLFSAGNWHIKENRLVEDDWYELEWKVKGDRVFADQSTHWSFRVGAKVHENPDIADVLYVSLRRSRVDFGVGAGARTFLDNSAFEYTYDMDSRNFSPVRHFLLMGKKWPLRGMKAAFSLDVGFILDKDRKYRGRLDDGEGDNFEIIVRPNIEF